MSLFTQWVPADWNLEPHSSELEAYADDYALRRPETKVLALVLEAIREPVELQKVLTLAAERDLPVVLLTADHSASGRAMATAHSGALAGLLDPGFWPRTRSTSGEPDQARASFSPTA